MNNRNLLETLVLSFASAVITALVSIINDPNNAVRNSLSSVVVVIFCVAYNWFTTNKRDIEAAFNLTPQQVATVDNTIKAVETIATTIMQKPVTPVVNPDSINWQIAPTPVAAIQSQVTTVPDAGIVK